MEKQQVAERITDTSGFEFPEIRRRLPDAPFEAERGHEHALPAAFEADRTQIARRLGVELRRLFIEPGGSGWAQNQYELHLDRLDARVAPWFRVVLEQDHGEPMRPWFEETRRPFDIPAMIKEAARSDFVPGAILETITEITGMTRADFARHAGLNVSNNGQCQTMAIWYREGRAPGKDSAFTLLAYAEELEDQIGSIQ